MQTLPGLIAVPNKSFGGETDHARAAEVDQRRDLRSLPVGRDPRAHAEPRGVPGATPRLTHRKRLVFAVARFRDADRLAVHVVGGHREWDAGTVDRRPYELFDDLVDPLPKAAAILEHRSTLRQRRERAKLTPDERTRSKRARS